MNQLEKVLYTAKAHSTGGRTGTSRSSDGRLEVKLSRPGGPGTGTNPEQLFAAGWSACFEGALGQAARELGIRLPSETAVDAEVNLSLDDAEGYFLTARLNVSIPGVADDIAQQLVDRANATCPYSKMTRNGIEASVALAVAAYSILVSRRGSPVRAEPGTGTGSSAPSASSLKPLGELPCLACTH
jgi:Ohr subfamily peroxiredoxin